MCLLLVKKFLLLMANHIKTLEGRLVSPGHNMRYTNIRAQQLLRFQAGNGPDGFGAEHLFFRVMSVRTHSCATAMLARKGSHPSHRSGNLLPTSNVKMVALRDEQGGGKGPQEGGGGPAEQSRRPQTYCKDRILPQETRGQTPKI